MTTITMAFRGSSPLKAKVKEDFQTVLLKTDPFQTAVKLVVIRERFRWYSIAVPC